MEFSIHLGSDEAERSGSASQAVSEESVHETESDTTAKKLDKELEPTDETAKENNATALDDINVAINGKIGDTPSENSTQLMEHLQSALSINSESNQPLIQADENVSDNETESDVKENVESERTSEVKPSEDEEEQKESSSDTEESSDFVDAEAINGVEMLPSSAVNDDDSDKVDSSAENASKERENQDSAESPLVCNDTAKDSCTENTESSNEENSEDPELQLITEGSQDDLLPSSTDAAADSSTYGTPRSSEASLSTTSENQAKVVTIEPATFNGVSSRNSVTVTDGAPIPPARKNKKKGASKGLSATSLGGCFPMACAGNTSPAFNLNRGDSVYGGNLRSRSVAHAGNVGRYVV